MINCINLYGLLDVSDSEDFEPRGCIDHGSSEPQSLVLPLASQVEEDPALAVTQAGVVDEDSAPAVTQAGVVDEDPAPAVTEAGVVDEDPVPAVTEAGVVDEDPAPAVTLMSHAVADEMNSYDSLFRRKRKKCDPAQWKQNIRKRAWQSGQEYMSSHSNQTIPRRKLIKHRCGHCVSIAVVIVLIGAVKG